MATIPIGDDLADMIPEGTSAHVCVGGVLHVWTRWRDTCQRCGEPISTRTGNPATWCDDRGHNVGGWDHQHGCGGWNLPAEVEVDLGDQRQPTDRELEGALNQLDREVAGLRAQAAAELRARLTSDLRDWIASGNTATGSDTRPGCMEEDGRRLAWDYLPWADRHGERGYVEVSEDDLSGGAGEDS